MVKVKLRLDGARIATRRELPPQLRGPIRHTQRRVRRAWRTRCTGAQLAISSAAFTPSVVIHTSGSAATETFPAGASNLEAQAWGPGGNGGVGAGTGCNIRGAGGGGAGAYSRASFNIAASPLKTLTYTVGTASGGNTTISSGTFAISTITCASGANGGNAVAGGANGTGGTGGAATNANSGAVNTTGGTGNNGTSGVGGAGAAGTAGNVTGDGSPYGAGGHGGVSASNTGQTGGGTGATVFAYT